MTAVNATRVPGSNNGKATEAARFSLLNAVPGEQVQHLLHGSDVDCLAMSESWLHENSPNAAIAVPGFNIFRNDRGHGGDSGVLCCVEDSISCNEILFTDSDLECLGLSVVLFPEMSFTPASITSSLWGKSVIFYLYLDNLRRYPLIDLAVSHCCDVFYFLNPSHISTGCLCACCVSQVKFIYIAHFIWHT